MAKKLSRALSRIHAEFARGRVAPKELLLAFSRAVGESCTQGKCVHLCGRHPVTVVKVVGELPEQENSIEAFVPDIDDPIVIDLKQITHVQLWDYLP